MKLVRECVKKRTHFFWRCYGRSDNQQAEYLSKFDNIAKELIDEKN